MSFDYLTIFIILCFATWIISTRNSGDLFSPAAIFPLVFIFSSFCAVYSEDTWNFTMSQNTFDLLAAGLLSYWIASEFSRVFYFWKKRIIARKMCVSDKAQCNDNILTFQVKVSFIQESFVLLIFIMLASIYIGLLMKTAGTTNILKVGSIYRNLSTSGSVQINIIGRLAMVALRSMTVVVVAIFFNNIFYKVHNKRTDFIFALCIFIYGATTLISGERTSTLRLFAMMVLAFSISWQRNNGFKNLISVKHLIVAAVLSCAALYGFSAIRFFVGRTSELDFLDYISFYAGGSIYNFNHFVGEFSRPTFDGHATFIGAFNNLARLGFGNVESIHREVVTIPSRGIYMGNVYTCFYDYYKDFGLVGLVILTSIFSLVINNLYYKAKYAFRNSIWKMIVFMYFGTTVFFASFTEQFFTSYMAISTISSLIVMWTCYLIVTCKRVGYLKFRLENR